MSGSTFTGSWSCGGRSLSEREALRLLADRDQLAGAAGRALTAAEIDLLVSSWADPDAGPTVADVALLDELRVLLGPPPKRHRRRVPARLPSRSGRDDPAPRPSTTTSTRTS